MRIDDTDPDELDDLDGRVARRTWLLLATAVLVIAGLVAAFLFVRGRDGEAVATTTVDAGPDTAVPDTEVDVVEVPPPDNVFPDFGSDYIGPELQLLYQRVTETGIRVTLQDSGDWNDFGGEMVFPDQPAVTTAESIAEAQPLGVIAPPDTVGNVGWQPAAWCNAVGGLRITMSFKEAIGVSNGQRYLEPRAGGVSVSLYSSGHAEGVPFRVLAMQVRPDVTLVTTTWADGMSDGGAPVNGWVAVASPGAANVAFDVTLESANGTDVIPFDDMPRDGDVEWQKGCNPPPPELPPAGEQPDDRDAAEQEVRAVFDLLWDRDIPLDEKVVLDDDTGVAEAIDQVDNGGFGEAAETAVHTMTELVFTSPTEAWFMYDLETSVTNFPNRFGIAYRIDGVWVISRAVICQDLSLGGGQCFPFVDQIYPPGSQQPGPVPGVPID